MGLLVKRMLDLDMVADLIGEDRATAERFLSTHQAFDHHPAQAGDHPLRVIVGIETYDLEAAFLRTWGIRRWRHASVSVVGQLQRRLADQKRIGRERRPGERSPAPLPDWYDLTHLAYEHTAELGFDPNAAIVQYLPGRQEMALNIAEALHLRQPA